MSVKAKVWQGSVGGLSTDLKIGLKNSVPFMQGFDFRKSPTQLSVLPGMSRDDNGVVKDLIVNEVMASDGTIYGFGNSGYFYRRPPGGIQSVEGLLTSGAYGMDYRRDSDSIYLAGLSTVSLYNPVTGIGISSLTPDKYGASFSTYNNIAASDAALFNIAAFQSGNALSYTPTTTIMEGPVTQRYFQSDIEPCSKVSIFVLKKGSGNWTLTLHDGLNNVLATTTITNGSLKEGVFNDFVFATPVRLYVVPNARTYHIHVTSTVADGQLSTSVQDNLSNCDLEIWADRLIAPTNGMHPMIRFLQYECFLNANYLSVWEPISDPPTNAEWQRHRLVLPSEYEGCGIDKTNEFLVMAFEKVSSDPNSTPQEGLLVFWDGTSPTYNYDVPIPEGSPYSLHTYGNVAYYYAGGDWYGIAPPSTTPVKLKRMPGVDTEFSGSNTPIVVYPYAATVRRGIHLMGWPSKTANTSINFGVYSWGAVNKDFSPALGYSYALSTGSQNYSVSNNLQIGMVKSFGDVLHVSWRDTANGGYGLDTINNSSAPAITAIWQSLVTDNGYASRTKQGIYIDAYYALASGASLTMAYKIDREATWHTSPIYSTTSLWQGQQGYAKFSIGSGTLSNRYKEIQVQMIITSSGNLTMASQLFEVSLVYDDLKNEALV